MSVQYLLDANVFIQAKNFHYRFDTFPGFWKWLDREQAAGQIASIKAILTELTRGNAEDELVQWAKDRKSGPWFLPENDKLTQEALAKIAAWVSGQSFKDPAKAEFLDGADPWLIAKALTLKATVVTHERYAPECKRKVPIPNVCRVFNVPTIDVYELMRCTGAKFDLQ